LIQWNIMRLWAILVVLLTWPFAVLHTLQARRRLRAYARPVRGPERLTLKRVA